MKKTLTNLLLMAGLTTSSVAGPIELNKALTDESKRPVKKIYEDRAGIRYEGEMLIEGPDYKTSILATRFYPFHTEVLPRLNLNFSIYNDRTSIIISDTGANGMTGENGYRDTILLGHAFSNGDSLQVMFDYMGEDDIRILK